MATTATDGRSVLGWAAIATSFLLAVGAVALFGMAQGEVASDAVDSAAIEQNQLFEARRSLELATLEVVAIRSLDALQIEGERSERLETAAAKAVDATAVVLALSEGEGPVALEAEALVDDLEWEALDDPLEGDLSDLFYVAEDAARYSGASEVVIATPEVIQQLSFVATLPLHVLIEGIAADASVNDRAADPDAAFFIDEMITVVREDGGWFGLDGTTPLVGSEWIEIDEATEVFPEEAASLSAMLVATDLIEYDVWMRDLNDGQVAPPFELPQILDVVDSVQPELVAAIDQLVAAEEAARVEAVAAQESNSVTLLAGAAVAALLALASFGFGAITISRAMNASRQRAGLAAKDALTGIGNRHELDERTRQLTTDPRFTRHVVAMIDFDFFKLVNDVYGHAAGDAILVEVAARLQAIADRIEDDETGVEATVIRMGGDEFLLTAHGGENLDDGAILADLDAVREDSIEFGDDRIGLGFSIGFVVADGQNALADLMSDADLLVYEDKAIRSQAREMREAAQQD